MKIILAAVNAKFIHSSLAVWSLYSYCGKLQEYLTVREFTINHRADFIVSEIVREAPDVVCFSCYIWNIELVKCVASTLRKVLPNIKTVFGGPEVSFDYEGLLGQFADIVIAGEGEIPFKNLVERFVRKLDISDIKGLAYLENGQAVFSGKGDTVALDDIEFVYKNGFDGFCDRIIYYETSRGCPYNCGYCLSSAVSGVRFLGLDRVFADLSFFLENNVNQVKFVDRTFNCDEVRAGRIWKFLIENDNGVTNFHFEIAASILSNDSLEIIKNARKGLFQFEIGVQSTNEKTLKSVNRLNNAALLENAKKIKAFGNIHLHLDLIAGLPFEDYLSFKKSFNDVYAVCPDQLQLGFLKLLKGSPVRKEAKQSGIAYSDNAPYEVLFTNHISYSELLRLKAIEEVLGIYYNSGKFTAALTFLTSSKIVDSPFDFYEGFADHWIGKNNHAVLHKLGELFDILHEFCVNCYPKKSGLIDELLKFDMLSGGNAKNLPDWLGQRKGGAAEGFFGDKEKIAEYLPHLSGLSLRQIYKTCNVAEFQYDVNTYEKRTCYYLFDYNKMTRSEVKFDIGKE